MFDHSNLDRPKLLRDLSLAEQENITAGQNNSIENISLGDDNLSLKLTNISNEANNYTSLPDGTYSIQNTKYNLSQISFRFSMNFNLLDFIFGRKSKERKQF
jgi:hypothetical protein